MKEIRITSREAGQRLDKYLVRYLPGAGKSFLYKMMRKKNIVLTTRKDSTKSAKKNYGKKRTVFIPFHSPLRDMSDGWSKSIAKKILSSAVWYKAWSQV